MLVLPYLAASALAAPVLPDPAEATPHLVVQGAGSAYIPDSVDPTAIALSPDGAWLVTVPEDGGVYQLWDVAQGALIGSGDRDGPLEWPDGSPVVVHGRFSTARIEAWQPWASPTIHSDDARWGAGWDPRTKTFQSGGSEFVAGERDHAAAVGGDLLAVVAGSSIMVVDTRTGGVVERSEAIIGGAFATVDLDDRGELLLETACWYGDERLEWRLRDARTGELRAAGRLDADGVARLSGDGARLVLATTRGVEVRRTDDDTVVYRAEEELPFPTALALGGTRIAVATPEGFRSWDTTAPGRLPSASGRVTATDVATTPGRALLAFGTSTLATLDFATGRTDFLEVAAPVSEVSTWGTDRAVAVSERGAAVVDMRTAAVACTVPSEDAAITSWAVAPDRLWLAFATGLMRSYDANCRVDAEARCGGGGAISQIDVDAGGHHILVEGCGEWSLRPSHRPEVVLRRGRGDWRGRLLDARTAVVGQRVVDLASGKVVRRIDGDFVRWVAPGAGRMIIEGVEGAELGGWSADAVDARLRDPRADADPAHLWPLAAAFDRDGRRLIVAEGLRRDSRGVAGRGGRVCLVDVPTASVSTCRDAGAFHVAAAWIDDDRFVTLDLAGRLTIWAATGVEPIATLTAFADGDWVAVDPLGRFESSRLDDPGAHWVVGRDVVRLDQLKDRYYEPGLLATLLTGEAPSVEPPPLERIELPPTVADWTFTDGELRFQVRDRGGGIGRLAVYVNDKELPDPPLPTPEGGWVASIPPDRLRAGGANVLRVETWNAAEYVSSRGLQITVPPDAEGEPPEVWILAIGVSDYRSDALDLEFPARDALAVGDALGLAAARFVGDRQVHVRVLGSGGDDEPTRANVAAAFGWLAGAGVDDTVVVFLAGHGVTAPDGAYHFLTADAASADLGDPVVRDRVAVSSEDIAGWLRAMPVSREVLVLDTCTAGSLIADIGQRASTASRDRALDRLKDRAGVLVLAGAPADRSSYEASIYGQGLLTHSLLEGMRGPALREGVWLDVASWFAYAVDRVPEIASTVGATQQPLVAMPGGAASFDIGLVDSDVAMAIPLASPRPLVVAARFQEATVAMDRQLLSRLVDEALRDLAATATAPFVYASADFVPGAWGVGGVYTMRPDGTLAATVTVTRDGEVERTEALAGSPDEVAHRVAAMVADACARR